ncbi:MAG: hypothetical protein WD269_09360 [Acidimicrobiia bacterium]
METVMAVGRLRLRVASWSLFVLGVAAYAAAFMFDTPPYVNLADATWAISFSVLLVVGLILTLRIPGNVFGWMVMATSGLVGAGVALDEYGLEGLGDDLGGVGLLIALSALYLFPDGLLPAKLWRGVFLAGVVALVGVARLVEPALMAQVEGYGIVTILLGALGAVLHRGITGGPILRRQIGLPLTMVMLGLVIGALIPLWPGEVAPDWVGLVPTLLITVGFPVSIGVSITRYRLYEIDRIISRTVSYAVIVGVLGLVLFGLVAGLGAWVGRDNQLVVAVSTLAVAALFSPVRRRVQGWVDRRFNRSRYDAERVMSEFAGSLRDRVDPDGVVEGWVGVVTQTMQPSSVGVWVRQ